MDGKSLEDRVYEYVNNMGAVNYSAIAREFSIHNSGVRDIVRSLEERGLVRVLSTKAENGVKIVIPKKGDEDDGN